MGLSCAHPELDCEGLSEGLNVRFGGFDDWARTLGGILSAAGVKGFRTNVGDLSHGVDIESDAMTGFLSAWYEMYQDNPVRLGRHDAVGPEDSGLLGMMYHRDVMVGGVDPTNYGQARRRLPAWIQERRDAPREIEIEVTTGLSVRKFRAVVVIRIETSGKTKANVYRLEVLSKTDIDTTEK